MAVESTTRAESMLAVVGSYTDDGAAGVASYEFDGDRTEATRLDTYREIGFDGPMRPDHVPTMAGEANDNPGYETNGRLFAVGYMRGLLDALD